jgi:hypothetical protein
MIVLLPLTCLTGGLAGYGKKKTGNNFYGQQAAIGGFGTAMGIFKVLSNEASHLVRPTHLLAIPVIVGTVMGVGNMMGRMVYDVAGN